MTTIAVLCQLLIALGIYNVWVLRHDRSTPYRPDGASDMKEEFARYGLPGWARRAVGGAKLALAALLLVGIFFTPVAVPAASAMALLMIAAVAAHVRVRDPMVRSVPALVMLLLSTAVVVTRTMG